MTTLSQHHQHQHTAYPDGQSGYGQDGYGSYRDALAHALTDLLTLSPPPLPRTPTATVLGCRDLLLSSLVTMTDQILGGAAAAPASLAAAATAPAKVLATTLRQLPRATAPRAPTDLLSTITQHPQARRWQAAARIALLAADALTAGEPATWRTSPDGAWAVMADTAAAAHALAVLDRRLATTPQLPLTDEARRSLQASWRTGLRLVATEVSRLAHTYPLATDADHTARPPRLTPFPVTDLTSLVAGYQHTHRLLAARHGVLPIRALGHLLVAQARIGHTLADSCAHAAARDRRAASTARTADAAELAHRWRVHAHTAEHLLGHRRGVAGLNPAAGHPALTQISEVLRGVQRLTGSREPAHLTDTVRTAHALVPTADTLERTIAAGIERAFIRGAYLVSNEHVTKRAGRLPWVPATPGQPHPLLTAATTIRTRRPQQRQRQAARPATAAPNGPVPPVPATALQQALRSAQPTRIGPPAMTQS